MRLVEPVLVFSYTPRLDEVSLSTSEMSYLWEAS